MLRFLSTRLWNGLLVMIGVSFISFLLFNYKSVRTVKKCKLF